MTRRLLGAALLLALAASGCTSGTAQELVAPGRTAALAHDRAVLHTVAARLAERPGVQCLSADVSDGGTGIDQPGYVVVVGTVRGLTRAQREALAREVGREVWRSPVTALFDLGVFLGDTDASPGPEGGTDLGRLLGTRDGGSVGGRELLAEYGPRPTPVPSSTPPPDPGGPRTC